MNHERSVPIRPNEIAEQQAATFPVEVIEVVNELLGSHGSTKRIVIIQQEIVQRLVSRGFSQADIFKHHWLDFEPMYRSAGWKVTYDKPGYNEDYEANFVFEAE